jgi:hypothetical protein
VDLHAEFGFARERGLLEESEVADALDLLGHCVPNVSKERDEAVGPVLGFFRHHRWLEEWWVGASELLWVSSAFGTEATHPNGGCAVQKPVHQAHAADRATLGERGQVGRIFVGEELRRRARFWTQSRRARAEEPAPAHKGETYSMRERTFDL